MPIHSPTDTFDLVVGRMQKASDQDQVNKVALRVEELRHMNSDQLGNRALIRDILDGGVSGIRAIIGEDFRGKDPRVPAANLMLSGLTKLAQKIGKAPDTKVDPPSNTDSDTARKAAEKRVRLVAHYDHAAKVALATHQMARWTPGYGFTPFVIESAKDLNGDPYPHAAIRDSFNAFPSQWTASQQPRDIAFLHKMGPRELIERFPEHAESIRAVAKGQGLSGQIVSGTAASHTNHMGWESQQGSGVEVYEYINEDGTWWVLPEQKLLLSFSANPISRPPFYVFKRFAFNKLIGQYDHVLGLMAAIARLNVLSIIAAEDAVFAETNISGELVGGNQYQKGRNAFNFFTPGTQVDKMQSRVPFELFQQIDRLERQLRVTTGYSVQDDGQSPNSFVTGRGLEELQSGVGAEIQEYFAVFEDGFQELDSRRLEWDEKLHGKRKKQMSGVSKGAGFSESYTPASTINGNYQTRRAYGAMAELDEPTKVVTLLNFLQNQVIDEDTVRENVAGLEDHTKIAERIRQNRLENITMQFLTARAEQGDVASMEAVVGMLRDGDIKTIMEDVFIPEEQEQQLAAQQPEQVAAGPPPDVTTALARMTQAGPTLGAQTVARNE